MGESTRVQIMTVTKQLVVQHPFDQISVTTIMKAAKLRRQTFYDYFHDKYEVLEAIYREEAGQAMTYCGHYDRWPETLTSALVYFDDNRQFYQRVIQIDEQNAPDQVITDHFTTMVSEIFTDMGQQNRLVVETDYCEFLKGMLGKALYDALQQWLLAERPASVATENRLLEQYLTDGINGYLLRMAPADVKQIQASGHLR